MSATGQEIVSFASIDSQRSHDSSYLTVSHLDTIADHHLAGILRLKGGVGSLVGRSCSIRVSACLFVEKGLQLNVCAVDSS